MNPDREWRSLAVRSPTESLQQGELVKTTREREPEQGESPSVW